MNWIKEVVDNALKEMSKKKLSMMTPAQIPPEMLDETIEPMDDWRGWRPIDSIITNADIQRFEKKLGLTLPLSYKAYLKIVLNGLSSYIIVFAFSKNYYLELNEMTVVLIISAIVSVYWNTKDRQGTSPQQNAYAIVGDQSNL